MDQDMVRDVQCCDDDHGDGDEGDNDDDGDSEDDDDDDAVILTTMTTAMLITTVRTMKMMTYATLKDKRLPGKKLKIFFWRIAANRIDSLPFAANLLPAGLLRLSWLTVIYSVKSCAGVGVPPDVSRLGFLSCCVHCEHCFFQHLCAS